MDFAVRAAMPGVFGLSGDLAGMSDQHRFRLEEHIRWYKSWRESIAVSEASLLTSPRPIEDRRGWVGLQLQDCQADRSLLFAYRLDDSRSHHRFALRHLTGERRYQVVPVDDRDAMTVCAGQELMDYGIDVQVDGVHREAVIEILSAPNE
jgi:hypothetical protein